MINRSYINSYNCILKRINKITSLIRDKDPNSFVIIHGDHGANSIGDKKNEISNSRLFNFIGFKSNESCPLSNDKKHLNSLQLLNIFFRCLSINKSEEIIENKSFYIFFTKKPWKFKVTNF